MQRGYIKLWRKIQDDPLWTETRVFSKAEAWLDILMAVQHSEEPQTVIIGMQTITVSQGETVRSQETWAYRWKWTRGKVRRFLELLQKTNKIRLKNEQKTSRITILNWDIYNKSRPDNGQKMNSKRTANEQQMDTDKKAKNAENDKNSSANSNFSDSEKEAAELVDAQLRLFPAAKPEHRPGLLTKCRDLLQTYRPEQIQAVISECSGRASQGDGWGVILTCMPYADKKIREAAYQENARKDRAENPAIPRQQPAKPKRFPMVKRGRIIFDPETFDKLAKLHRENPEQARAFLESLPKADESPGDPKEGPDHTSETIPAIPAQTNTPKVKEKAMFKEPTPEEKARAEKAAARLKAGILQSSIEPETGTDTGPAGSTE